ncbi:DUF3429 domain-containing protein [Maricaulis sp. CAU 1757]
MSLLSTVPPTARWLGLLGLVPFWIAALSLAYEPTRGMALPLYTVYGALIVSFLGGVRWGRALAPDARPDATLWVGAVLPSLLGLAALSLRGHGQPFIGLALVIAGLLALFAWDMRSVAGGSLPDWYGKLRIVLTGGAVLAGLVIAVSYALAART